MKRSHPNWTDRFSNSLPKRDILTAHPWLQPVSARVLDPQLWQFHEAVARCVAVGMFRAFVIPVAQIVAEAVYCTW